MNGWTGGLIGVVVAFLFMLVLQSTKRPVGRDPVNGELVLRFHPILTAIMALSAVVGPVGMVVLSCLVPFKTPEERYIPLVIGLFFFLLGGGMAIYFSKTLVRVNHEGLVAEGLFGGRRAVSWQEVVRARYGTNLTFALVTATKKKVEVHFFMKGLADFAKMVEACLPEGAKQASQADLKKLQAMLGQGR